MKNRVLSILLGLTALLVLVLGMSATAYATGASLEEMQGGTMTASQLKDAILSAQNHTYDGQGVTVDFSSKEGLTGYYDNTSEKARQVYLFGDQNSAEVQAITIKNVKFTFNATTANVSGITHAQIYPYLKGNLNFENCVFDVVGMEVQAIHAFGVSATFKNCTFKEIPDNYAIKHINCKNFSMTNCLIENCGSGLLFNSGAGGNGTNTDETAGTISVTGNTFKNVSVAGTGFASKDRGVMQFSASFNPSNDTSISITDNTYDDVGSAMRYLSTKGTFQDILFDGNTGITTLNYEGAVTLYPYTKNSKEYLTNKAIVAKIGEEPYASLKAAVDAAQSGDIITLIADDKVSFSTTGKRILIDKTLTITSAVDEEGKPKYTVYGHPTDITQGMNMIFVKPTASAITFTVSNVAFSEFGNENTSTNIQGAIIYVSEGSADGTSVVLNNLNFEKFNRDAIRIYKHSLTVDGCTIDCAKTGNHLTKGIALNNGANATINNTFIKNSGCTYVDWDSAAIESIGGCTAFINNCTVVDSENGIIIQGQDAQGTVTIKNSNISVSDCAVSSSGKNIAVAIESGEYTGKIDVRGLDSTPGSKLTITGGNFKSDFRADLAKDVEISGGTFDLSENTYCDLDTLDSYCKAGYYPFAVENKTDVYIVLPSVTVTFNANGGAETDPVTQKMQKNVATALAENSFTAPIGKQFGSWNTLASPTEKNPGTSYADKAEVTLAEDLTLYAQWIFPPATVVTEPEANTLFYTGQAQELVTAGEAEGGEIQYALGTKDAATEPYTTFIPTATNVGTYYVWYKVVGNPGYSDIDPACIQVTIAEAKGSYSYASGAQSIWQKQSGVNLSFRIVNSGNDEKTYGKFTDIQVDGKPVDKNKYEAKPGSVIINLKPTYLETLSVGKHTLNVVFEDGNAETTFTIIGAGANAVNLPQTGDAQNPLLYAVIALISLAGIGLFRKRME